MEAPDAGTNACSNARNQSVACASPSATLLTATSRSVLAASLDCWARTTTRVPASIRGCRIRESSSDERRADGLRKRDLEPEHTQLPRARSADSTLGRGFGRSLRMYLLNGLRLVTDLRPALGPNAALVGTDNFSATQGFIHARRGFDGLYISSAGLPPTALPYGAGCSFTNCYPAGGLTTSARPSHMPPKQQTSYSTRSRERTGRAHRSRGSCSRRQSKTGSPALRRSTRAAIPHWRQSRSTASTPQRRVRPTKAIRADPRHRRHTERPTRQVAARAPRLSRSPRSGTTPIPVPLSAQIRTHRHTSDRARSAVIARTAGVFGRSSQATHRFTRERSLVRAQPCPS